MRPSAAPDDADPVVARSAAAAPAPAPAPAPREGAAAGTASISAGGAESPRSGPAHFAEQLKAAAPTTSDGTPTRKVVALRGTDLGTGAWQGQGLGGSEIARRKLPTTSTAETLGQATSVTSAPPNPAAQNVGADGSWKSSLPAAADQHDARWAYDDVDYSADPRTSRAIVTEVKAHRQVSGWQAATGALTAEQRQTVTQQRAQVGAAVAHKHTGIGMAMIFDNDSNPPPSVLLKQRYSAGRQHEVKMHTAVTARGGSKALLHPEAKPHAAAARRCAAERARQSMEARQSSGRASDWGAKHAPRANGIAKSTWSMHDKSAGDGAAAAAAQPLPSRKNANSPGFSLG